MVVPVVNDLVRLLPEHVPNARRSTLMNGRVLAINEHAYTIKNFIDEFTTEESTFNISLHVGRSLQVISQEEVDTASTCWDRQHVAFVESSTQTWCYGQVDALAFPTLPQIKVATTFGSKTVGLGDEEAPVVPVYPVIATLLAQSRFRFVTPPGSKKTQKTLGVQFSYTLQQLEDMHRKLYDRVMGEDDDADVIVSPPDDLETQPNIPDILRGILVDKDMPLPGDVRAFVNPYNGHINKARVIHVVLHTHYQGKEIPSPLQASIGVDFCADPRVQQPLSTPPARPRSASVARITSLTATDSLSQLPVPILATQSLDQYHSALAHDNQPEMESFLASSGNAVPLVNAHQLPPTPVDNWSRPSVPLQSTLPVNIENLASFMRQVPSGFQSNEFDDNYKSSLANASLHSAVEFMATHRQRIRETALLTLDDCWAAYSNMSKDAKYFTVSNDEFEFHWWITAARFRSKQPAQFLTDCIATVPQFFMLPHPGVMMFVYRLAFGSGQLSVWHFRKVSELELKHWNDTSRLSLTVFPAKLLPPPAGTFKSIRDLQDALTNILTFASYYGSASFQQFAHAAKTFLDTGIRQLQVTDLDTPTLLEWFDDQFQFFTMELFLDIQQHRDPPRHVVAHYCFDTSGTKFSTLLLRMHASRSTGGVDMRSEIRLQVQAELAASRSAGKWKNKQEGSGPLAPMPDNLQRLVPKHEGKPCCLRALCKQGCRSKLDNGTCGFGSLKKLHFAPEKLDNALAQWASKRWGGFKSEHAHLLPG